MVQFAFLTLLAKRLPASRAAQQTVARGDPVCTRRYGARPDVYRSTMIAWGGVVLDGFLYFAEFCLCFCLLLVLCRFVINRLGSVPLVVNNRLGSISMMEGSFNETTIESPSLHTEYIEHIGRAATERMHAALSSGES